MVLQCHRHRSGIVTPRPAKIIITPPSTANELWAVNLPINVAFGNLHSGPLPRALEASLVLGPDEVSAFAQMLMEVGQVAEGLVEACGHELHDSFSLAYCGHEIAFFAQVGIELDVVAVLVLVLEESGVEEDVGAG